MLLYMYIQQMIMRFLGKLYILLLTLLFKLSEICIILHEIRWNHFWAGLTDYKNPARVYILWNLNLLT